MSIIVHFDKLSIELIHKIMDYLETDEIYISLHNINKHIDDILNTYNRYRLNFQSITMSNFYFILHHINPTHIISLTLSDMDDTAGQFKLFHSLFSMKQFTQLESLQLIQPSNPIHLNMILTELHTLDSLLSLSIVHCSRSSVNQETFHLLSSIINTCTSLRRLYLSGASLNTIFKYKFISTINHLYFNNNLLNTTTLQTIFSRMSHLKSLETAVTCNMTYLDLPHLTHLTRLTITIFISMKNSDLKILLDQMSSLSFLKIIANGNQWFNGHFWEQCLPSNLITFQFNFSTQSLYINEQTLLESFKTPFWITIKHWYVMLDYQMNPSMIHLYSLPYCDTEFYYRPSINATDKFCSTAPIDKSSMSNVKKLTIDLSEIVTDLDEQSHSLVSSTRFFPNISTLILTGNKYPSLTLPLFDFIQSVVDLTHIVEFKLGKFHDPKFLCAIYNSMPQLHSLQITETVFIELTMLDFRNIRSLTICDCLKNVDKMYFMFPYLKHLCVRLITFQHIQRIFELLDKTLLNISLRQIRQDMQQQILEWLHERYGEHRRFSYQADEHMNLHIWLNDFLLQGTVM